jgi:hypothetical protein
LVFYLGLGVQVAGILFLLLIPTWIGLVYLMGLRSTEERYVDVALEGLTVVMPVEKIFLPHTEIEKVRYSRLLNRITIKAGIRKIRISRLLKAQKPSGKISLKTWLGTKAPSRADIRKSMQDLHHSIQRHTS